MRLLKNIISFVFLFCSISSLPEDENGHIKKDLSQLENEYRMKNRPEERDGSDVKIPTSRSGVSDKCMLWKDGKVPFKIDTDYSTDEYEMIIKAIRTLEYWTCINFLPYNPTVINQPDYVIIGSRPGQQCKSHLGRAGGGQGILLESSVCFKKMGYILHELLHTIGITDEHRRPDRDNYITINRDNMVPEDVENFEKGNDGYISAYSVPYDYNSVMHYSEYASSVNGKKTIEPKMPLGKFVQLGQRDGISVRDAMTVMKMYNCKYAFNLSNSEPYSRVMPNYEGSPLSKEMLYNIFYMNISYT